MSHLSVLACAGPCYEYHLDLLRVSVIYCSSESVIQLHICTFNVVPILYSLHSCMYNNNSAHVLFIINDL